MLRLAGNGELDDDARKESIRIVAAGFEGDAIRSRLRRIVDELQTAVGVCDAADDDTVIIFQRDGNTRRRMALTTKLRRALADRSIDVHYQPIVDLPTGALRKVEALARWTDPEEGPISPGVFIPLAEASKQIIALGELMIGKVVEQLSAWDAQGLYVPCAAVNVSAAHLRHDRLLATIDATAARLTDRRGLVYRYRTEGGVDGLAGEEGTFLLCTFWLAHALALAGEVERARTVFERAIAYVNDVGLLAEEVDPASGELLGNFPQAFSHIGLVNAAWAISEAERRHAGTAYTPTHQGHPRP